MIWGYYIGWSWQPWLITLQDIGVILIAHEYMIILGILEVIYFKCTSHLFLTFP